MNERIRIELRLTRELKEASEAVAKERGTTLSEMIRAQLSRIVKRHASQEQA